MELQNPIHPLFAKGYGVFINPVAGLGLKLLTSEYDFSCELVTDFIALLIPVHFPLGL